MKRTAWPRCLPFSSARLHSPRKIEPISEADEFCRRRAADLAACPAVMDARHEGGLHRRVLVGGAPAPEPGTAHSCSR